jgi:cytoskeleton protein RodZ
MTAERADFGARLRAVREARGISLREIAATTKISVMALEALERNDVSRLPGGLFSRAFVRAYAKEVGLDPEQTVREFVERFSDDLGATLTEDAVRVRASRIANSAADSHSGLRWLGLAVTVALIIVWVGIDRYCSNRAESAASPARSTRTASARTPAPPTRPKPAPAVPPGVERPPTTSGNPQETPFTRAASMPAPLQSETVEAGKAAARQGQPQTRNAAPPSPGTPPTTDAAPSGANLSLQVVLSPRSACWVSATVDGKRIVGRTLTPGDKVELSAARAIVLTAGDAGALAYTVNNAPGRSLGAAGQVVTVVINTANYQTFIAGRQQS